MPHDHVDSPCVTLVWDICHIINLSMMMVVIMMATMMMMMMMMRLAQHSQVLVSLSQVHPLSHQHQQQHRPQHQHQQH